MSKFNLTAQIQLQAPKNAPQIVQQIQRQLSNVNVNLQVQNGPQATRQVNNLTKATNQAANAADRLGKGITGSIKRYAGMAIATRAVTLFTNTLGNAIQEAIDFERELVKVVQVTGRSIQSLRGLTNEITRLSTSFGASSTSLINVSRILSQAGLDANETKVALDALARTTLAPTFDDIASTAEGAVAIFNQFRQGAEALEKQLGSINAVAGKFAVEAGDLISVIRRTGGVFKAAGGDLNELIALFTSVRSTTRESAESIATGLRTIFTRIQRPKTIEFLREFGVELTDLEGRFVGPFEAVKRLSEAFAGLEQGDLTFIEIAEELGGFRQIGKVIPLIQEFRVSQEALNTALKGQDSLTKDAATAQQALAVRIGQVKEEFLALVRAITETKTFQFFANTALNLASALLKVADALKPLIPLLGALATVRLARGLAGGLGAARGALFGFNRGGMVPGSGNTDTVPAMLTPGEFVVRKGAVAQIGAENLFAMNKYAAGGRITDMSSSAVRNRVFRSQQDVTKTPAESFTPAHQFTEEDMVLNSVKTRTRDVRNFNGISIKDIQGLTSKRYKTQGLAYENILRTKGAIGQPVTGGVNAGNDPIDGKIGNMLYEVKRTRKSDNNMRDKALRYIMDATTNLNGNRLQGVGKKDNIRVNDVTQFEMPKDLPARASAFLQRRRTQQAQTRNKGGSITGAGTDTVPALLTPGEFVVNKASAQRIGYNNLKHINRYASGGVVRHGRNTYGAGFGAFGAKGSNFVPLGDVQKAAAQTASAMNKASKATNSNTKAVNQNEKGMFGLGGGLMLALGGFQALLPAVDENSGAMLKFSHQMLTAASTVAAAMTAVEAFGIRLNMTNVGTFLGGGGFGRRGNARTLGRFASAGRGVQNVAGSLAVNLAGSKAAGRTGLIGAATRKAATAIASAGDTLGPIIMQLGPMFLRFIKILGPVAAILAGFYIVDKIVKSFRDLEGQLEESIKARDKELATANALSLANSKLLPIVGNITSAIADMGDSVLQFGADLVGIDLGRPVARFTNFLGQAIGGNTFESIEKLTHANIDALNATDALTTAEKAATQATIDFKQGIITALDALATYREATRLATMAQDAANEAAQANRANRTDFAFGAERGSATALLGEGIANITGAVRNVFSTISFGMVESTGQRNRRIDEENVKMMREGAAQTQEVFEQSRGFRAASARSIISRGGTVDDVERIIGQQGGFTAEGERQRAIELRNKAAEELKLQNPNQALIKEYERQAEEARFRANQIEKENIAIEKAIKRNREAIEAMSLNLERVNAASSAGLLGIENYFAKQEFGFNPLRNTIATLKASITNAAMGISQADLDAAVEGAAASIEAVGGDAQKFRENIKAVQQAQKMLPSSAKELQKAFKEQADRGIDPDMTADNQKIMIADIIAKQLEDSGMDAEVAKRIKQQIMNMDLSDDQIAAILSGKIGAIGELIEKIGEDGLKQVLPALEKQAEAQDRLNKAVERRIQLEDKYADAQKKAIATQLEVAEIIARNGGPAVTNAMRIANNNAQGNVNSRRIGGISDLVQGTPEESRRRAEESRARLEEIKQRRRRIAAEIEDGVTNEEGLELAAEERRLLKFQEQEADRIRQNIQAREAEIEIIKARNAEEKKGLESLLQGDFEAFFDSQAAVGATAALATGNQELINAFGAAGMAGAFQNLQNMNQAGVQSIFGQDIGGAGGLLERGAAAALSPFGLQGQAQALAGTDPDILALQELNREEAAVLQTLADTTASAARMDLEAAKMQIIAAKAQLKAANQEVDEAMEPFEADGRARGGLIYANRGIFVPRGTDTVPAMLTPGEFVVRRSAVQRGNNLSLLKAINTGATAGPGATQSLSRGGSVQYLANGGDVTAGASGGLSADIMTNFASALNNFNTQLAQNIQNLQNTTFNITLNPTNINVNLTGTSFLEKLTSTLKQELFSFVGQEIKSYSVGPDGKLTKNSMGV